jgi:hypothetical protein
MISTPLLTVKCCCEDRPLKEIKALLFKYPSLIIEFITYREYREDMLVIYTFRLVSKDNLSWGEIVSSLLKIKSILEIHWEEADVP